MESFNNIEKKNAAIVGASAVVVALLSYYVYNKTVKAEDSKARKRLRKTLNHFASR